MTFGSSFEIFQPSSSQVGKARSFLIKKFLPWELSPKNPIAHLGTMNPSRRLERFLKDSQNIAREIEAINFWPHYKFAALASLHLLAEWRKTMQPGKLHRQWLKLSTRPGFENPFSWFNSVVSLRYELVCLLFFPNGRLLARSGLLLRGSFQQATRARACLALLGWRVEWWGKKTEKFIRKSLAVLCFTNGLCCARFGGRGIIVIIVFQLRVLLGICELDLGARLISLTGGRFE